MQNIDDLEQIIRSEVTKGLDQCKRDIHQVAEDTREAFDQPEVRLRDPISRALDPAFDAPERLTKAEHDLSHYQAMNELLNNPKSLHTDPERIKKLRYEMDQLSVPHSELKIAIESIVTLTDKKWDYAYSAQDKKERLTTIIEGALSRLAWGGKAPKQAHVDFGRAGGVSLKLGKDTIYPGGRLTIAQDAVEVLVGKASTAAPSNSDSSLMKKQYRSFMRTEGQSLALDPLQALRHDITYQDSALDLQPTLGQTMYYQSKEGSAKLMACTELKIGCAVVPDRGTFIYRTDAGTIQETENGETARRSKNPLMTIITELELDATNTKEPMKAQYTRFELTSFSSALQSKARTSSKPSLNKESLQSLKSEKPDMKDHNPNPKRG